MLSVGPCYFVIFGATGDLNARKVPYFLLRGTVDERAATVRRVLERFRKYMNPAELFGGNQ